MAIFPLGWIVEFRLGPSLFGKKVNIFCNHPTTADEDFQRKQYRLLEWQYGSLGEVHNNSCNDDTAIFAQLPIRRAGSFHYYFTEEGRLDIQFFVCYLHFMVLWFFGFNFFL